MKLVEWLKDKIQKEEEEEIKVEPVIIEKVKPEYKIIDEYDVNKPNSRVKIVTSPEIGEGLHYFIEETELSDEQHITYQKIVRILSKEFTSPSGEHVDPIEYVYEQAEIIAEKYHKSLGKFTIEQWDSIFYYVVRDQQDTAHYRQLWKTRGSRTSAVMDLTCQFIFGIENLKVYPQTSHLQVLKL